MPRVLAKIGDQEVVYNNFLIIFANQDVEIFPFDDDEEFSLVFRLEQIEDGRPSTERETDENNKTKIIHRKSHTVGRISGQVQRSSFAHDENYDYFFSFTVNPIGKKNNNFACELKYMISRRPL